MIKKVFLLTKRFPYDPPMEAPLADEIRYWAEKYSGEVFIIPKRKQEHGLWELPKNIKIAELPEKWKQPGKIIRILEAAFSPLFLKECFYLLLQRKVLKPAFYKSAFSKTYEVQIYRRRLAVLIDQHDGPALIYSYWFNQISYAAALLKEKRPSLKVIARAVSKDLYEFRNTNQYLPLKRQFKGKFDQIYTISKEGLNYLQQNYNFPAKDLAISRKGIHIESEVTLPSKINHLVLLSIAVFKPLKRIDKIINAVALFSENNPEIKVTWHHLGGVVLDRMEEEEKKLQNLAKKAFFDKNIKYHFHGTIPHSEILEFLKNQPLDVIINASETEGVPLSIMEAMAYGIPAIAPNVGGISELVNNEHGILMSKNPSIEEIAEAIASYDFYKKPKIRQKAKHHINEKYNIANNYPRLIKQVISS